MLILQKKLGVAASIVPGYVLWLDGQDLSTLWQDTGGTTAVTSDNDPVKRWDDKSGNGYHVTNGTAGNDHPHYSTNDINTNPAVEFVGGQADSLFNTASNIVTAGGARSIFVAMRDGAGGGSGTFIQFRRTGLNFTAQIYTSFVYTDGVNAGNNATATFTAGDLSIPRVAIFRSSGSGNALRFFLEGDEKVVAHGGGSIATETGTTGFTIGNRTDTGGQGWTGSIGEIIVYDSELSDVDQAANVAYLTSKWGI